MHLSSKVIFIFIVFCQSIFSNAVGGTFDPLSFVSSIRDGQVLQGELIDSLRGVSSLAISPDGNYLYAASYYDDAVTVFAVDRWEAQLSLVQTWTEDNEIITHFDALTSITLSPDGRHLYVASLGDEAITVFQRDTDTGALSFVEVLTEDGIDSYNNTVDGLSNLFGLGLKGLSFTPDGKHLYTANSYSGHAYFSRDPLSGKLKFLGNPDLPGRLSHNNTATHPNNKIVFTTDTLNDAIHVFHRDILSGELTHLQTIEDDVEATDINSPSFLTLSNDGRFLYVTAADDDAVSVFIINENTGLISLIETLVDGGTDRFGKSISALEGASYMTLSVDNSYLYVLSKADDGVTVFKRDTDTGHLELVESFVDGDTINGGAVTLLNNPSSVVTIEGRPFFIVSSWLDSSLTLLMNPNINSMPELMITQPINGQKFTSAESINATGVAYDPELGLVSESIQWNTSIPITGLPILDDSIVLEELAEGSYKLNASISFSDGSTLTKSVHIVVNNYSLQPVEIVSKPITTATTETLYQFDVEFIDNTFLSANPVTGNLDFFVIGAEFSLGNHPLGMTIDSSTGLIEWTPTLDQVGTFPVTVRLKADYYNNTSPDPVEFWATLDFVIQIASDDFNSVPIISSTPLTEAVVGHEYSYEISATDTDGDPLVLRLAASPPDMSISSYDTNQTNESLGTISWTPSSAAVGGNPVTIEVQDGRGGVVSQSFVVTVSGQNLPPSIVSSPVKDAIESKAYVYDVHAVDPNLNDLLSYSLDIHPDGMNINSYTGLINWAPEEKYVAGNDLPNTQCALPGMEIGTLQPQLKWAWRDEMVRHAPLVAQLSDDNGDGQINAEDEPDVVFVSHPSFQRVQKQYPGTIKVINGGDGTALSTFTVPSESISGFSHVALGDIDGDGVVEIVAITEDSTIVAYDHTGGTPKWESEPFMPNNEGIWSTLALADLDGDSTVEIMVGKTVLNGNDGSIKWVGEGVYI
ncbi:MAG: beta-propeller fold lactonase family protein, partial [Pseudomonadales bacterium]|nr:beta-propeller fold lactonase family protein [Pseudomonadales bacterium]